jgi:hypothetical protein
MESAGEGEGKRRFAAAGWTEQHDQKRLHRGSIAREAKDALAREPARVAKGGASREIGP